jgi:HEAT repeat protein
MTFDGSDAAFGALDLAMESNPAAVIEQARSALTSENPNVRFAAVYALGLSVDAGSADILVPVLANPDPGLRLIAAGALSGLGIKESLPVLIEALGSDETVPYSHPPQPQWTFAESALVAYTGQDFGVVEAVTADDQAARQAALDAWRAWWHANGEGLVWDAGAERYRP